MCVIWYVCKYVCVCFVFFFVFLILSWAHAGAQKLSVRGFARHAVGKV